METLNIETLPPRIPASTVCKLAGYSRSVLWRRIKEGRMPKAVDEGREKLFLRDDVLRHLGLSGVDQTRNPFEAALD